jgi:hypothetical protein
LAWAFIPFRRRPDISITLLIGIILVLLGGVFVLLGWPYRAAVSSGVGGSLIAAALVSGMSSLNDEAFEEFRGLGIKQSFFYRSKVADEQWCKWLREARTQCTLLGIAHHKWCEESDFPEALEDALRRGVKVKFLFLDPSSAAAGQRTKEDKRAGRNTVQAILDSIKFLWTFRRGLPQEMASNLRLYVYDATPSSGTSWFDNFMIVTHYLAGFANVTSPALRIEPVPTEPGVRNLYDIYTENVRKVEESFSYEIDQRWYDEHFPLEVAQP